MPRHHIRRGGSSMGSSEPLRPALKKAQSSPDLCTTTKKRRGKKVSFGDLEIYTFPQLLGDNPSVSDGAPLTLDWTPEDKEVMEVEYYEYTKKSSRARKDLVIPSVEREVYLLSIGYKLSDIVRAAEKTRKARKERFKSLQNKKWDSFNGVMETTRNKLQEGLDVVDPRTFPEKMKLVVDALDFTKALRISSAKQA